MQARVAPLARHAQQEVAAEGEPDEVHELAGKQSLQAVHGADHFRQPAGVEQLAVEVVRGAMIAQIQTNDVEASLEQLLCKRQDIEGLGAALPAMQQNDGCARPVLWTRMKALQTYAVAAVQKHLALGGDDGSRAACDRSAARRRTGKHRLQMAIPQPAGWLEFVVRLHGHGS